MSQTPQLTRLLRKLLRYGAMGRAARVAERLTTREVAEALSFYTSSERALLLELLLASPKGAARLTELPRELLVQGLAAIPEARLTELMAALSSERRAALERHLSARPRAERPSRPSTPRGFQGPGLGTLRRRLSTLFFG